MEYHVARIEIRVWGQRVTVEAAVSDKLPHSVLLGTDVPELVSLFEKEDKSLMVVTRNQAKRLKRSQPEQSREKTVDTSSVAEESGNRESTVMAEESDRDVGLLIPELEKEY